MHYSVGQYKPSDIEIAAAFDIDKRKVGRDVAEAIFAPPNCTTVFCPDVRETGVKVRMGKVLDGYSSHMKDYSDNKTFLLSGEKEPSRKMPPGSMPSAPWTPERPS
jgi:myo-inositol-1-phosphate synthase